MIDTKDSKFEVSRNILQEAFFEFILTSVPEMIGLSVHLKFLLSCFCD